MIHAVCDFCGKDADLHATFMTLTPFENFGRYHRMTNPFGVVGKTTSFVICSDCRSKKGIPNPYCEYHNVEEMSYTNPIDSKTEDDWAEEDVARDPNMQKILGQIRQSQAKPNPNITTTRNSDNTSEIDLFYPDKKSESPVDPEDVYLLGILNTESED